MLNADLIISVQDGHTDLMGALWERYRRYAAWYARRWLTLAAAAGLAEDDLQQEAYLALCEAVSTTKTGADGFIAWYKYALQKRFATVTGQRTAAGRNEPLNNAVSLDAPVSDENDAATLADSVPDETAADAFNVVDQGDVNRLLHDAVAALSDAEQTVIILRYWHEKTFEEIGRAVGVSKQAAALREKSAIRHLRERLAV